jgi:tRNA(Arg) A34 adenosine deaminase TadA|tara:strand:+ start:1843 stop:2295 length:453 start_codon:yes stop_codon:yes gene_type:complete
MDVNPITPSGLGRRDYRIMDFARRQAIDNDDYRRAKLAAIIGIKNKIISVGTNKIKTHPFQKTYAKNSEAIFLHAEINAIKNSLNHIDPEDLRKSTLYIYRVKRPTENSKQWINGMAKPCTGCMRAIVEFEFKRVIYTTDIPDEYAVINA